MLHSVLDVKGLILREQLGIGFAHPIAVLRVHTPEPEPLALAVDLLRRVTENAGDSLADQHRISMLVGSPHNFRDVFNEPAVLRFALTEVSFSTFLLALDDEHSAAGTKDRWTVT